MLWLIVGCTFALGQAGQSSPLSLSFPPPMATNCSVVDQTCDIGQDNLLTSYAGVESLQECEALCTDNLDCEFITHFGPDSFPLRNYCMLFSECGDLTECQDCTTAEEICFQPNCSHKLEGPLEENVLEIIPGVEDELSCKAACRKEPDCEAYTYHDNSDPVLPGICFLLTEIQVPLQSCEHCSTGFPDCRNITEGICYFTVGVDTTPLTSYKFTKTGNTTVNILAVGNQDCELTVVAVGGGGSSGSYSSGGSYGGGGSGYLASTNMTVSPSQSVIVRVGGPGQLSSLETSEGQTIITAQPGEDGDWFYMHGGAGYSRGGAGSGYSSNARMLGGDGGEDGGDGHDAACSFGYCTGGPGSHLDLSSLPISSFLLTPGRGGNGHYSSYGKGGGGGVLVENTGPQDTEYVGQGYGGGGALGGEAGPGVVLLEIISNP